MPAYETSLPITTPEKILKLTAPDGKFVIECFDLGSHQSQGYVSAFDPEFADGRGGITFSSHRSKALRWRDFLEACDAWRTQSKKKPVREDGKPNRPMTAYSIQIV